MNPAPGFSVHGLPAYAETGFCLGVNVLVVTGYLDWWQSYVIVG